MLNNLLSEYNECSSKIKVGIFFKIWLNRSRNIAAINSIVKLISCFNIRFNNLKCESILKWRTFALNYQNAILKADTFNFNIYSGLVYKYWIMFRSKERICIKLLVFMHENLFYYFK